MNFEPCSVAKDCLRTYYCVLDDMTYSLTRCKGEGVSELFVSHLTSLHRASCSLSENLLTYSSWEPIREIALLIEREKKQGIRNMRRALRSCPHRGNSPREYTERFELIRERMIEDMRCREMSERINSDFIRQMLPLLEGEIRLAENALCFDLCPALVPYARSVIESNKGLITAMRKLICILDQSCG
ncbi:MAG: hypothetical protein E7671_02640 [Ruminococcaceae bacterium]|nr:hypothetical protein [Oscillospiraceae bacterium]